MHLISVAFSAAMSTAGNRMALQRLKDFETESNAVFDRDGSVVVTLLVFIFLQFLLDALYFFNR